MIPGASPLRTNAYAIHPANTAAEPNPNRHERFPLPACFCFGFLCFTPLFFPVFLPFQSSFFFSYLLPFFLSKHKRFLLIRLHTTNKIYPKTPPIVFNKISSTSKLPTLVKSCIVSTPRLSAILKNNILKNPMDFPAMEIKKP